MKSLFQVYLHMMSRSPTQYRFSMLVADKIYRFAEHRQRRTKVKALQNFFIYPV